MADFYTVLSRAVSQLPTNTPEVRQAVYERARNALIAQLRRSDPPIAESEITRARLKLDEAVTRLELELAQRRDEAQPSAIAVPLVATERPLEAVVEPVAPAVVPDMAPEPVTATVSALPEAIAAEPAAMAPIDLPEAAAPAAAERALTADAAAADSQNPARPRLAGRPRSRRFKPEHLRTVVVTAGIALAVGLVAGIGFYVNRGEPQPIPPRNAAAERVVNAPAPQGDNGKISERVGADAPQGGARPTTPQAPATAAQRPALPVAQRAILYVESATNPQQPVVGQGRISWRLDTEAAGPGQPADTLIRADAEFPEQGLRLTLTVRRNLDASFPASHILGMQFTRTSDDGNGAVKEAGVPQFKADENERGAPLSAITSTLRDNLFVTALSNVKVELDRNVELLTKRTWIDIPVRFASGRRGIIAIEKGFSGDQTINDAFNRWRG